MSLTIFPMLTKNLVRKLSVLVIAVILSGITISTTPTVHKEEVKKESKVSYSISVVEGVYAATGDTTGTPGTAGTPSSNSKEDLAVSWTSGLNTIFSVLSFIITPLIMLAGWLMDPAWTLGDVFNMRGMLHSLWVLVSNVVYVVFAFLLIVIAFRNIFGEAKDHYALKTGLPKLLVGVIMVPFTWFIVSASLSVASIATASVIQLPSTVIKNLPEGSNWLSNIWIPKTVYLDLTEGANYGTGKVDKDGKQLYTGDAEECAGNMCKEANADKWLDAQENAGNYKYKANKSMWAADCDQFKTVDEKKSVCMSLNDVMTDSGNGVYGILSVYAYGIFKIHKFKDINFNEISKEVVKNIGSVVEKLFFGLLFYAAFAFIIIALVAALFIRAVHMWLYAIFSPIFALGYFFGGKMPGGKAMEEFQISKFLALAFMPVLVGAALSFGLVFIGAALNMKADGADGSIAKKNGEFVEWSFGKFTFATKGTFGQNDKVSLGDIQAGAGGALDVTKTMFGKVIIDFLAILLLWMAVKAALSANEITKKVTEPIFKFGETLAKSTPIPIPGVGKLPVGHAGGLLNQASNAIESAAAAEGTKYGRKFGEGIANSMGLKTDEASSSLANSRATAVGVKAGDNAQKAEFINNALAKAKIDAKDLATNPAYKREWVGMLNAMGLTEEAKKFESATTEKMVGDAMVALETRLDGKIFKNKTKKSTSDEAIAEMKQIKASGAITSSADGKDEPILPKVRIDPGDATIKHVVRIDDDTAFKVQKDGSLEKDALEMLRTHIVEDMKIKENAGNYTKLEFENWLKKMGITITGDKMNIPDYEKLKWKEEKKEDKADDKK